MRGYLPVTAEEISSFLSSGSMECGPLYAPTIKFLTANSDLDEEHGENFVNLRENGRWEDVQCAFLVSPDGDELTWFATQEISAALPNWLKG
jgi:hypothetical protein